MPFYRYHVQEVPFFAPSHYLQYVSYQHSVLAPSGGGKRQIVHVFHGCESVKSEIFVDFVSVVKKRSVVVECRGVISVRFGDVCEIFERLFSELALVRIFSCPEKFGAYACQHFKLRIGCARAACRHFESAGCEFFAQLVEHGRRILRDLYILVVLCHCKRFELEHYYIGMLRVVIYSLEQCVRPSLRPFLEYALHQFLRISLGHRYARIGGRSDKTVCYAVIPVRIVEISKKRAQDFVMYEGARGSRYGYNACRYYRYALFVVDVDPAGAPEKHLDDGNCHYDDYDSCYCDLHGRIVCGRDGKSVREILHIV